MHFNQEQKDILKQLGEIAQIYLYQNEKRVTNALHQALEILSIVFKEAELNRREAILEEFEEFTEWDRFDLFEELLVACLNTSQSERGLEIIDLLISLGLYQELDIFEDKASFLSALGRQEEAEQMLKGLLADMPDNLWLYISLGDIYFINTPLEEHQDFAKAEAWYYQAYDREIGKKDREAWEVLLERLGSVTIARLRREIEERLLGLLEKYNIGTYRALEQLKQNIYISSNDSFIFQHLQMKILHKIEKLEEANKALQLLNDAYNLMPQKALDGLSPFEMVEYMPKGEQELRIMDEMFVEFDKKKERECSGKEFGALGSQEFTDFQIGFMKQNDPATNKKRRVIVDKERKKTQKDYESGKIIWVGFEKYR
ncbi:MAG: hypothetical protein ABIG60_00335 [Patescibacteria group bacterium]